MVLIDESIKKKYQIFKAPCSKGPLLFVINVKTLVDTIVTTSNLMLEEIQLPLSSLREQKELPDSKVFLYVGLPFSSCLFTVYAKDMNETQFMNVPTLIETTLAELNASGVSSSWSWDLCIYRFLSHVWKSCFFSWVVVGRDLIIVGLMIKTLLRILE